MQAAAQQTAIYSLIGHKGDLMFLHFRKTFEELNQAEIALSRLRISEFLEPTTSYLSMVELGLYESTLKLYGSLAERGIEPHSPEWNQEIETQLARQRQAMAQRLVAGNSRTDKYICFYPMDRRRGESVNWYQVPMAERQRMMHEHGMVGRRYARRCEADHHRFDRLRRLGMGRGFVRRRSAGFQETDLRDAVR